MTVIRQRIDMPIPRKRKGSTTVHEKVSYRDGQAERIGNGQFLRCRVRRDFAATTVSNLARDRYC